MEKTHIPHKLHLHHTVKWEHLIGQVINYFILVYLSENHIIMTLSFYQTEEFILYSNSTENS